MTLQSSKSPIGLDSVAAAETALSHVDGQKGELIIAGERVADLAAKTSFEGGEARVRAHAHLPQMLAASEGLSIVDGFRAAVATLRAEHGITHEATIVGAL